MSQCKATLWGGYPNQPSVFFCCCSDFTTPMPPRTLTSQEIASGIKVDAPESGMEITCLKCNAKHRLKNATGFIYDIEHL